MAESDNERDRVETAVLVVDVGASHVKLLASGQSKRRRFPSGGEFSADEMVAGVLERAEDWRFDVVSIGIPARVKAGAVLHEPVNLGSGWAGFDYPTAFGKPTKVVNDAVMQAIGAYEGGHMLFLGLGTGLGSAMIVDGVVQPMELGHLPFRKATYEDYVGERGLKRHGRARWRKRVVETIELFIDALEPDYVVLGGGNADELPELPANVRLGGNEDAFRGGFLLWGDPRWSSIDGRSIVP
jgi:predicted NBD/HSP70 family sugar kinase